MTARKEPIAPAPDDPASIITAAEEEIRAAEEAAETLENAVRGGDETVTQDDVENARKRLDWAKLRRAAADVKARKLAEQRAKEAAQAAMDTYYATATEDIDAKIRELLEQARGPITEAIKAATLKNAAIFALAGHFEANPQPDAPESYTDGRPRSAWVAGPDGRRHGFTYGQKLVASLLDDIVRSL